MLNEKFEMEISVIMPVYNAQGYLKKSVNSVLHQSYTDFELILVNDGSTDMSLVLCRAFAAKDKRVRVIDLPHGGVAAARKAGISEAKGKYLAFVDSDDWVENDFLQKMYSAITKNNADIVISRSYFIEFSDSTGIFSKPIETGIYSGNNAEYIKNHLLLCFDDRSNPCIFSLLWDKFFKSELLKRNLQYIDDCFTFSSDSVLAVSSILDCECIAVIENAGYHYLKRKNSIMHSNHNNICEKILTMRKNMYKALDEKGYDYLYGKLDTHIFTVFLKFISENTSSEKISVNDEMKSLVSDLHEGAGCPEWQNTVKEIKKYISG